MRYYCIFETHEQQKWNAIRHLQKSLPMHFKYRFWSRARGKESEGKTLRSLKANESINLFCARLIKRASEFLVTRFCYEKLRYIATWSTAKCSIVELNVEFKFDSERWWSRSPLSRLKTDDRGDCEAEISSLGWIQIMHDSLRFPSLSFC